MQYLTNLFVKFLGDYGSHDEYSGQMSFDCPACIEEGKGRGKYKLALNYKKNKFKCWVCAYDNNMYGSIPKLINQYGNKEILKEFLLLQPENSDVTEIEYKPLFLPNGYIKLSNDNKDKKGFNEAYGYLISRGITNETIDKYDIGYTLIGKYANRIIIPSYDSNGKLNYFISRTWLKWGKPKYLNPDVKKEEIIFNDRFLNWDSTIYLVEGVFDHLCLPNSIPVLGKVLSKNLKNTLVDKCNSNIVIIFDPDAINNAKETYRELNMGKLLDRVFLCNPINDDIAKIYELKGNVGVYELLQTTYKPKESEIY
jgi:hypothetical protein